MHAAALAVSSSCCSSVLLQSPSTSACTGCQRRASSSCTLYGCDRHRVRQAVRLNVHEHASQRVALTPDSRPWQASHSRGFDVRLHSCAWPSSSTGIEAGVAAFSPLVSTATTPTATATAASTAATCSPPVSAWFRFTPTLVPIGTDGGTDTSSRGERAASCGGRIPRFHVYCCCRCGVLLTGVACGTAAACLTGTTDR